eukprot:TRINITY_DN29006_c0_g1_i4.p1 TRINITY_DN29006_c0_g1~~TRINITY_DN29006_c0_g1_i4.p1  ORF type:complete len:135 (-),score=5.22 TRINITY_DN29006_c0_g1_i4:364-768(-)
MRGIDMRVAMLLLLFWVACPAGAQSAQPIPEVVVIARAPSAMAVMGQISQMQQAYTQTPVPQQYMGSTMPTPTTEEQWSQSQGRLCDPCTNPATRRPVVIATGQKRLWEQDFGSDTAQTNSPRCSCSGRTFVGR